MTFTPAYGRLKDTIISELIADGTLKGDPGGSTADIGLFNAIGGMLILAGINRIQTSGCSVVGQGPATYVSDSLANSGLATAHPLFCKATANGRYFRLMPDADGSLPVSASGAVPTATPIHTTNHQPAVQALVKYANEVGVRGIQFERGHYSIWAVTRSAPAGASQNDNKTGFPVVSTSSIDIIAAKGGTTLNRRCPDGSDPNVYANWPQLDCGAYFSPWRGGMFFMTGTVAAPANYADRPSLTLNGVLGTLDINGGLPMSTSGHAGTWVGGNYLLWPDGSGWDVRDKPCWFEADRNTGDFISDGNVKLHGFRGELLYFGGGAAGSIYQTGRLELYDTDGDAWNPGPCVSDRPGGLGYMLCDTLDIHNAAQALEVAGGRGHGHIKTLIIRDCLKGGMSQAGQFTDTYATGANSPSLVIDSAYVARSTFFGVFHGVKIGKAHLVDTQFWLGASNGDPWDNHIESLTIEVDRTSLANGLAMNGPTVGFPTNNYVGHIHFSRTAYGEANGQYIDMPVGWYNALGANNVFQRMTGVTRKPSFSSSPGANANWSPSFVDVSMVQFSGGGSSASHNVETTPAVPYYYGHYVYLTTTTNSGMWPVTLPNLLGKLPAGAKMKLYNAMTTAVMAVLTANTKLDRPMILRPLSVTNWEWDGYQWAALNGHQTLKGTVSGVNLLKAAAAIPANDVSDETAVTVPGLVAGMRVTVTPFNVSSVDALLTARVTGAGAAGIRAKNMLAAATLNPGSNSYTVTADYPG